jgi:hypothetical protein
MSHSSRYFASLKNYWTAVNIKNSFNNKLFKRVVFIPTNQTMKNLNSFIFFLFLTLHLTAQTPRQVLDLVPGTTSTFNDVQDELKIGVY